MKFGALNHRTAQMTMMNFAEDCGQMTAARRRPEGILKTFPRHDRRLNSSRTAGDLHTAARAAIMKGRGTRIRSSGRAD